MKFLAIFLFPLFLSASARLPFYHDIPPDAFRYELSIYEIAESISGAPAELLRALAIVESGERDHAIGDQGRSLGRFQINEDFRSERVRKFGEYDPFNPRQAAIIAGFIYMENLARLKDETLAICAYRQGVSGVMRNGATLWYYDRVRRYYGKSKGASLLHGKNLFFLP